MQSVLVPHTMDIVKKTNLLLMMTNGGNCSKDGKGDNNDLNGVMLDQYKWSSASTRPEGKMQVQSAR